MSDLNELIKQVDWKKSEIVPVIVQSVDGEVLTLAYMNEEALRKTLETGYAYYYSRSQRRIRMKGEVSGNVQKVKEIKIDCDSDALLLIVEQVGVACHTSNRSCFYRKLGEPEREVGGIDYSLTILRELEEVIKQRKENPKEGSYTSRLFKEGKEKIYKKFGEEAVEVLVAEERERIIYETADLIYHLLVLLAYNGISLGEVMKELRGRRR
ncbi:bifunctional phosphoribosyl-AMP cyclohydrolase/phosphoribosyl-ATP diphosphatase HisIE [Thermococcus argininiproducens]|uniref:Histidine biosynthesis bifunctional protein HisIE n=1 Tax=Thermococcus argininiproducens TaxID=2866384 RepID=A0A9E7M9E2_9EURY|nr:bifunctional phosphoribosyl-AMP cyclohydrolase/phosphoribosyl-ATP diphosphatase HisIE [Thermococcus argininiproducens]USG99136.1 bifunctional phosphoribosyl-AMP cyclohydrolase/phosphoribosyl-ATP diphosphatase HisIE [Thermococcus argininiproducens]